MPEPSITIPLASLIVAFASVLVSVMTARGSAKRQDVNARLERYERDIQDCEQDRKRLQEEHYVMMRQMIIDVSHGRENRPRA